MVLGRAAQHGRTPNIDILDRLVQGDVRPRHGLLERIKIHHHQVNRLDPVGADGRLMRGVAPQIEQPPVHFGVQRLDPAIQHLRKARIGAQVGDLEPGFTKRFGRAAGRNQLHARLGQRLRQRHQTGLVGDRKQCPSNCRHWRLTYLKPATGVKQGIAARVVGRGSSDECRASSAECRGNGLPPLDTRPSTLSP